MTLDIPDREVKRMMQGLERASASLRAEASNLVKRYLLMIERDARRNMDRGGGSIPRTDTGRLKNSIRHALDAAFFRASLGGEVFTDVHYAVYVHEGTGIFHSEGRRTPWVYFDERRGQFVVTRGIPANPFLRDAFEKHVPGFVRDLKKLVEG